MSEPPTETPPHPLAEAEPRWERPPSATEAFAAPAHDPRDIITPHAFRISPTLLGLPLATPMRRAIAMGIDGLLVVMLTKTGGVLLAMVAAVFVYGWLKNRYRKPGSKLARGLGASARVLIALLIFSVIVSMMQPLWERYVDSGDDEDEAPSNSVTMNGSSGLVFGAAAIALKACDDAGCRADATETMAASLDQAEGDRSSKLAKIGELIDAATDDAAERSNLRIKAENALNGENAEARGKAQAQPEADAKPAESRARKPEYSLLKQVYGMLDDLGLSIGWAAAYFTLFTTLWAGQTPGKKLMRIRVVHLSGKPLSYWMSFGRYGGYAAGFSTGLLGFLQIFWDPNRQAIQDQLSFTAVIRDTAPPPP